MPRIIHFELPADNPERAAEFYENVFGWQFQKWEGPQEYWLITTGPKDQPGINGGLMRRQYPGAGTCNTVDVASVDGAVTTITKHGGKNVVPKMAIPGVGYLAYCSDPEGNVFGLMQADPNAH
jgi:predicted enzyme related to lactoylglutathione lyase